MCNFTVKDGFDCLDHLLTFEEMCEYCKDEYIQRLVIKQEYETEGDR